MVNFQKRWRKLGFLFLLTMASCIGYSYGVSPFLISKGVPGTETSELRGVWVQDKSLTNKEDIDRVLQRVKAAGFNAVFVNVFSDGETLYQSSLTRQIAKVAPGFDPLAYLVPEAHRQDIDVHAWFVTGRVGREGDSWFLEQHPEWGLVGPDGKTTPWLNFSRPDVRKFINDLVWETVEGYNVDGIHFDYLRYPDPEWGFDDYSKQAFAENYHQNLDTLRYADLPAYGNFEGNPLTHPGSALVLATFSNGLPALTLNRHGDGEVVLFNWDIVDRKVGIGAAILQRALGGWLNPGKTVYILRSETNAEKYGYGNFEKAIAWLEELAWEPHAVEEIGVADLPSDSVLILPNVYLISSKFAQTLEDFVYQGGRMIFMDGPTPSIKYDEIQAITGMQGRGTHFDKALLMTASEEHPLIPMSRRTSDLYLYQTRDALFKEFRRQGISDLLKEIYRRVKRTHPGVEISVTITSDQLEATHRYLQDWPAWLKGGYIDFLVPRGYVERTLDLAPVLRAWQPFMDSPTPVTMGLKAYVDADKSKEPKSPDQLVSEVLMARHAGFAGVMIFDLENLSDQQEDALAIGPFSTQP